MNPKPFDKAIVDQMLWHLSESRRDVARVLNTVDADPDVCEAASRLLNKIDEMALGLTCEETKN